MARGVDPLSGVVPRLGPLLEAGEATRGLQARSQRGAVVLSRDRQESPSSPSDPDPRFRLSPLGRDQFGLSLYRRNRWERLPFQGTLRELVDVMNTALAPWATDF